MRMPRVLRITMPARIIPVTIIIFSSIPPALTPKVRAQHRFPRNRQWVPSPWSPRPLWSHAATKSMRSAGPLVSSLLADLHTSPDRPLAFASRLANGGR